MWHLVIFYGCLHDHVQMTGQWSLMLISETRTFDNVCSLFVYTDQAVLVIFVAAYLLAQVKQRRWRCPGWLRFEEISVKVSKKENVWGTFTDLVHHLHKVVKPGLRSCRVSKYVSSQNSRGGWVFYLHPHAFCLLGLEIICPLREGCDTLVNI